jgi:hypothetical protein
MRLCTFEIQTPLGRHYRVGSFQDGVITDLNFAVAWYLAQQGEADPQRLADALVPSRMAAFLAAGLRAMHTSQELFLGDGPRPADWWKRNPPPKGPNDETLVYAPQEVRLMSPILRRACAGSGEEVRCSGSISSPWRLAAIIGKEGSSVQPADARRYIAGFTAMMDFGAWRVLGPYLVTSDEAGDPYQLDAVLRVNGQDRGHANSAALASRLEKAIQRRSAVNPLLPGQIISLPLGLRAELRSGDQIELEIAKIGTLRARIAAASRPAPRPKSLG